jgi:hypothetical protein
MTAPMHSAGAFPVSVLSILAPCARAGALVRKGVAFAAFHLNQGVNPTHPTTPRSKLAPVGFVTFSI